MTLTEAGMEKIETLLATPASSRAIAVRRRERPVVHHINRAARPFVHP